MYGAWGSSTCRTRGRRPRRPTRTCRAEAAEGHNQARGPAAYSSQRSWISWCLGRYTGCLRVLGDEHLLPQGHSPSSQAHLLAVWPMSLVMETPVLLHASVAAAESQGRAGLVRAQRSFCKRCARALPPGPDAGSELRLCGPPLCRSPGG